MSPVAVDAASLTWTRVYRRSPPSSVSSIRSVAPGSAVGGAVPGPAVPGPAARGPATWGLAPLLSMGVPGRAS